MTKVMALTSDVETENDLEILEHGNGKKISYQAVRDAMNGEHYEMSLTGEDAKIVIKAVNIGIDPRLQACFCKELGDCYDIGMRASITACLDCSVSPESLPVLLRRLYEDLEYIPEDELPENVDECDAFLGSRLADDILYTLGFDECGEYVGREALGLE